MAIDATGIDSWQRSKHYERRIGEQYMPYVKADVLVDTKDKLLYDHVFCKRPRHDVIGAETIFKRLKHKNVLVLADKRHNSEPLHKIVEKNSFLLYAPVRNKRKNPRGKNRKRRHNHPPHRNGMKSIAESIIRSLKVQIDTLSSRLHYMKKREFA